MIAKGKAQARLPITVSGPHLSSQATLTLPCSRHLDFALLPVQALCLAGYAGKPLLRSQRQLSANL